MALETWPDLELLVEQRQPLADDTARLTISVTMRNADRAKVNSADVWVATVANSRDTLLGVFKFL